MSLNNPNDNNSSDDISILKSEVKGIRQELETIRRLMTEFLTSDKIVKLEENHHQQNTVLLEGQPVGIPGVSKIRQENRAQNALIRNCTSCNAQLAIDQKFCTVCGANANNETQQEER